MDEFFPLPVVRTSFQSGPLHAGRRARARAAAARRRLARVARRAGVPVEAIRVGASAARSSGLAWLVKGLRLPGGALANLPLRNVLRTPRRTLLTLLGIGAIVTLVCPWPAPWTPSTARSRPAAKRRSPAPATASPSTSRHPRARAAPESRRVADDASVGAIQPSLRLASTLIAGRRELGVALETVADERPLWHPTFQSGGLPAGRPGLILARAAADTLHVGVGDRIEVEHPVPSGPGTLRLARTRLPVTGIHTSPLRFIAYANEAATGPLGVAGLVNRISVVPAAGRSGDEVKAALLHQPSVAAVQGAAATTEAVDRAMEQFNEILLVTVTIAAAMSLLIAFNAAAINADERAREHATMFAYGVPVARVMRGGMAEALLIGALGTAVGLVAGRALLSWIINTNMRETMPDIGGLIGVGPTTYLLAVISGVVVVALGPLLTMRRLRRTDIPATLRVVE